MIDIKTWADGEKVTPADMKKYVSGALRGFLEPPACRRTVANLGSQQKPGGVYQVVEFDKPGMGQGAAHSYDTTGGFMSKDPYKIYAPADGLYEISFGLIVRAVSDPLTWVVGALSKNQTDGGSIAASNFLRVGFGRATSTEKVGAGSATVPLRAGDFASLAVHSEVPFLLGSGNFAQFVSHFELRWVGVKP
ncbi:hypothetical protein [Streptomyces sp. NPDC018045]|uniref:hypothetical protein n=1 Tax=Streptomyces sp. NPDC018045 TaxID=3365037 RepID=UPI003788E8E4